MNKEELLQELSKKVSSGEISQEEIKNQPNLEMPVQSNTPTHVIQKVSHHFPLAKILYVLGAAIVIIGVIVFLAQIWDDIGSFGRILASLGLGLVFAAIGSTLMVKKPGEHLGAIFHFIGAIVIPIGVGITLFEFDFYSAWSVTIASGILFAFYLLLAIAHKHVILTFFAILNGTSFVFFLVQALLGDSYSYYFRDVYAYTTMIVGASYILLARSFIGTWNKRLVGLLYFFGTLGFLGAVYSRIFDSVIWRFIFPLFVIGGFFLSVKLKSRIVLVLSTIFLIAYVFHISSRYFANSLGWAIYLIILGLIIIGLGYMSITIDRKYLKK